MLALSTSLLITTPVKGSITPFQPTTDVVENNNINGMVNKNPMIEKLEKDKIEFEQKKIEKQIEEQKKNESKWQEFELTFYTSLSEENSGNGTKSVTCTGGKLYDGVVASNYYKLNTKIKLQGWGEVVVADRGSDKYFNNDYRLDVYIPRNSNESDSHYHARVEKMGKIKVKGRIING
jgi:3D (Asp-Asp-Asp) domain-containing protein